MVFLGKDRIHCEEAGEINVKGLAYPVVTYVAVDSYENLGKARQQIREEHANLKLDIDLDAMNSDERRYAARALRRALDQLARPEEGEGSV